ncbi:Cytochrome P450 [Arthrobacter sp. cf158]|uniref:cytochrome P450 n=1 Tax=Arthrobacter sp. cf158 TaxID=1761744 RepID=UPI000899404D|nr:cytochrome P450 [Arthrobacter sp. cf158]SDW91031.1 Cytochrome P450 [Arthrobacter sp. cf158]
MGYTHDALSDLVFEEAVPYEYFDTARRDDPVRWVEEDGGPGYWSVTRYADVLAVTRNFKEFSSEAGGTTREDIAPADLLARQTLIDTDPPAHTRMRRLLAPRFTPGSVHKEWLGFVETTVMTMLDRAFARKQFDYVAEVASTIPIAVLGELLGVPDEDRAYLMGLGDEMIAGSDPDHAPRTADSPENAAEYSAYPFSSPAGRDLWEYADDLRQRRKDNLGHDIFSLLMTGTIGDRKLSTRELDNFFSLLVVAGNETTRMALSHGLLAFAEHPEQFNLLQKDASLLPTAVEEVLRWATPIHHFRRTALVDTEIAGTKISAGDKILIWYASANRDETVFEDPYSFDITRKPNPHIAFGGGGPHICLGNSLARLELQIVFRELARRVHTIEIDGPVRRLRSNLTHGIKELPVSLTYA